DDGALAAPLEVQLRDAVVLCVLLLLEQRDAGLPAVDADEDLLSHVVCLRLASAAARAAAAGAGSRRRGVMGARPSAPRAPARGWIGGARRRAASSPRRSRRSSAEGPGCR